MNRQGTGAFFQPDRLHEHRQSANVIAVRMGDDDRVDCLIFDAHLFQGLAARLAAIDENAHYQERLIVKLVDLNEQTGEFRAVNVWR